MPKLPSLLELEPASAPGSKAAAAPDRQLIDALEDRLAAAGLTLPELISRRSLYFRVSVAGNCNLSCPFCHNEGGPNRGSIDPVLLEQALAATRTVGFDRVQFTGGEPLISPHISDYVRLGTSIFSDVGITTNGVLLPRKLTSLLEAGLTRIHISLQKETLVDRGEGSSWMLPAWLNEVITECVAFSVRVRFNLPVAEADLPSASEFLIETRAAPFSLNVFALLSGSAETPESPDYVDHLRAVVAQESQERSRLGVPGKVQLRSYLKPNGLRCASCRVRSQCTEASRSLRLGSDGIFRPCLASRESDFTTDPIRVGRDARAAALLALDYLPFDEEHHAI